jgi:hypothetical protein
MSRLRVACRHALPSIVMVVSAGCMDAADDDASLEGDESAEGAAADGDDQAVSKAWAANERDDHFGDSIATGDFDGDGFDDVAIGATGEAPGAEPESGAVFVFRGSATGLAPWRVLTQETPPVRADGSLGPALASNVDGDEFGRSLAAADLDGDGVTDLAIGIPGKRSDAGAVMIFTGHRAVAGDARSVLVASAIVDEANLGIGAAAGERFGNRLIAGNFDGEGGRDLAIAATGEGGAGAVFVVRRTDAGFVHAQTVTAASAGGAEVTGQFFGLALARGPFTSSRFDDLVVGAPGHTEDGAVAAGAIAVFRGGAATLTGLHWQAGEPGYGPNGDSRFGEAVAVGEFDFNQPGGNIVVGAPGHGRGVIFAFRMDRDGRPEYWNDLRAPSAGYPDAFAGFGSSILIGRIRGERRSEMLVGAPRGAAGGRAFVIGIDRWGTFAVAAATRQGAVEAGQSDGFASSLALANVDGTGGKILVTAPFGDDGAIRDTGAVYQFQASGNPLIEDRRIWQRP